MTGGHEVGSGPVLPLPINLSSRTTREEKQNKGTILQKVIVVIMSFKFLSSKYEPDNFISQLQE